MGFDPLLVQTATLQKGTVTRSEMGQENIAWADIRASIPVLVLPARPPADIRLGLEEEVTHVIFARPIAEISAAPTARWKLVIDSTDYLAIEPRDPGHRKHHWEIRARRVS